MTRDISESSEAFIIWRITNSSFTGTTAVRGVASISMGSHAFKQSGDEDESYIRSTSFTNISGPFGGGTILIAHLIGAMTLTDVTFDGLSSDTASCGIHGDWREDSSYSDPTQDQTYVKLQNCSI